jgi:hypothetical protein
MESVQASTLFPGFKPIWDKRNKFMHELELVSRFQGLYNPFKNYSGEVEILSLPEYLERVNSETKTALA